jgi:hypothetical protein
MRGNDLGTFTFWTVSQSRTSLVGYCFAMNFGVFSPNGWRPQVDEILLNLFRVATTIGSGVVLVKSQIQEIP